jgi:ABC-2 type transport system ATP-binding protein
LIKTKIVSRSSRLRSATIICPYIPTQNDGSFMSVTQSNLPVGDVVVQTTALTRTFGDLIAVDHVTLSVNRGEIFGLIGPNGAGKSTLIKMLTTLLPPSSGTATVAGYDIVCEPAQVRRHIGYVPQLLSADGSLTGYENLLLSARLYGVPRKERTQRINRALARMGLAEAANRLVGHFSGGMIRRLEIAQSLLHRPAVLFLDEPTVGLDPGAREAVWERVLDLRNTFQRTMIVTSHHMDEIDEFCDRIALVDRGRIVAVGTPSELKAKIAPDATLDDVFVRLLGAGSEAGESYGDVRRARRAAREHG